jgi:hypothetical protein
MNKVPRYSQLFIFFVTYKWATLVGVLYYTSAERFARDRHFSWLGPFVSYEENEGHE